MQEHCKEFEDMSSNVCSFRHVKPSTLEFKKVYENIQETSICGREIDYVSMSFVTVSLSSPS